MKAGTTSLHRYLANHPDIFMSTPKEIHFFTGDDNWARGLDWYASHFDQADPTALLGEASTSYTKFPRKRGVAERIAKQIPKAKLIYLVRDPIPRMRSHYLHERSKGREKQAFPDAVRANPDYLDYSRYWTQILQYLDHFPREQLLVLTSEELREARERTLNRVWEFLSVPAWSGDVVNRNFNTTEQRRVMRPIELLLRRTPGFRTAVKMTPLSVKKRVRQVTTRAIDPRIDRAEVDDDLRKLIKAELEAEVARLREFLGSDLAAWSL